MNYKEKYTEVTGQKPYCWTKSGQYVKSGSYSDEYVKWLEEQLSLYGVSERFILMVMYNDKIIEKRISTSEKYIDDEILINKEVYKHLPNAVFYKGILNAH